MRLTGTDENFLALAFCCAFQNLSADKAITIIGEVQPRAIHNKRGRPVTQDMIERNKTIKNLHGKGMTYRQVAQIVSVHPDTVRKIIKGVR